MQESLSVKKNGRIAVVTDSASDIPPEYRKKYDINVVPLYIHYDGKEFKDGIDITSEEIYTLQKNKKAVFSSSSPSPQDFNQVYQKLLKGHDRIISIHLSSKLSAVIKAAKIAQELSGQKEKIHVYDSLSGTMGSGILAITASKAAFSNISFENIIGMLDYLRSNTKLFGTIDTLKYLSLSGRVPSLTNLVTGVLKIKPILGIFEGVVGMVGLAFTRYGSLLEITRRAIKEFRTQNWVAVSLIHTLSFKESEKIASRLRGSLNCVVNIITDCTPVVGAHTGPGLVGIIISGLNREIAELYIK